MTAINMTRNCIDHEFIAWTIRPSKCLICLRRYNAEYQRKLQASIRDFLNEYRISAGCAKCGYNEHHAALQFDHIVPESLGSRKKRRTSLPQSLADAKRFVNDSNIQVLCANCHCIKTRENKDYKSRSEI